MALWLIITVSLLFANPGRAFKVSDPEMILKDSLAYGSLIITY